MQQSGVRAALVLGLSVLSACNVPNSPAELAERLVEAATKGNEVQLTPLLAPEGKAQALSAAALRLKFQGLSFAARPASGATSITKEPAPKGLQRSFWFFEVSIAGTDRFVPAARLQIDCRKERRTFCQLTDFVELPWSLPELTSTDDELSRSDATRRVWLVTSIDVLDPRLNVFAGRRKQVLARAEALFLKWARREAPDSRPGVVHLATQHDLARILLDPRSEAIFWISHGSPSLMIDYQGFELAPVWRKLFDRSRASRIALVSCQSNGIVPADPRVIDFDHKVDMLGALEYALKKTTASDLRHLRPSDGDNSTTPAAPTESILLARKLRASRLEMTRKRITPAIRIESNHEILATLPGKKPFESADTDQSIEIQVPLLTNRIVLTSGDSYWLPLTDLTLGDWELLTPGWKFFGDSKGRPIGVTRNIVLRNPNKEK